MAYLEMQFGYTVKYDSSILTKEDVASLEKSYDAVFLGIGLGLTSGLKIKGEDQENCFGAVEFVEELRKKHHAINVPKK